MHPSEIKALIDAMAASDLSEMEWSRDGWTLRLLRRSDDRPMETAQQRDPPQTRPARAAPPGTDAPPPRPDQHVILAPVAGVVYLAPSPGAEAFVSPGTLVEAGTTLCVVEAMKTFIEVRAEQAGVVEAILVRAEEDVTIGQLLFRIT